MKTKIIVAAVVIMVIGLVSGVFTVASNPSMFFAKASIEDYPMLKDDAYKSKFTARYFGYQEDNKVCFDNSPTVREIASGIPNEKKISCQQDLKAPYYIKGNPAVIYCDAQISNPKLYYEKNYSFISDDPRNVLIEVVDCGDSYFVYQNGPEVNLEHNFGLYGPFKK